MRDIDSRKRELAREDLARPQRLARLVPDDPELRLSFANKLMDSHLFETAIAEIRAVIAMAPNNLEARKLLERALALRPPKSS